MFIDQTPGYTQVNTLKSSSEDEDADSCRHQGYDYNYDAIDMENEDCNNSFLSSSEESNSLGENRDSPEDGEVVAPNSQGNSETRLRGGRPKGSTIQKKLDKDQAEAQAKYKICCRYI